MDLEGVRRAMWAVEVDETEFAEPALERSISTGGLDSYPACRQEARRLSEQGATALRTPSAALEPAAAGGQRVELGFRQGPPADGIVFVLFGTRPNIVGWLIVDDGRPPRELLRHVRHL